MSLGKHLQVVMSNISNPNYWTNHFMNLDKKISENNNLYTLDQKGAGIKEKLVKVVTPGTFCNLRNRTCPVTRSRGIKRKRPISVISKYEPPKKKRKTRKKKPNKIAKTKKKRQSKKGPQRRKTRNTTIRRKRRTKRKR